MQARALFANPISTQGTRMYREATADMPALRAFEARLRELLDVPLTYDEARRLALPTLSLTPEAKAAWVEFYNEVERELAEGRMQPGRTGPGRPRVD